jgi:hypothetical protein
MHINSDFGPPLTWSEVKATARSVAKWVWQNLRGSQQDYINRTHTSEMQSARGRRSGEKRREKAGMQLEFALEMREQGMSPQQIIAELNISKRTFYNYMKKYK